MLRLVMIVAAFSSFLAGPVLGQAINEGVLYDKNKARILKIRAIFPDRNTEAGTGVIISPDGYVLTALHVIGGSKDMQGRKITILKLDDFDRPTRVEGDVFVERVEPGLDLALLRITGRYSYAELSVTPLSGTPIVAAIFWNEKANIPVPFGGRLSVPDVAAFGERWSLAMQVIPGNSGAPVFDASGKVVAIITNQLGEADKRFALAAPLSSAREFLPTLSPEERQSCINKRRALETRPEAFEVEAAVQCEGVGPPLSNRAEYAALAEHTIAGLASHEDDMNEYGWVGAVEYTADDKGRVSSARIDVHCMTANQSSKGWAKTKLRVNVRKILTDVEHDAIQKACVTR